LPESSFLVVLIRILPYFEQSMAYNTAAYVWKNGGPGQLQDHVAEIQASGLTTVILFGIHIGQEMDEHPNMKVGDLIYNDYPENLIVSCGKFNPNNCSAIKEWPEQIWLLKQKSSVSRVFITLGGAYPEVKDFDTIQTMFKRHDDTLEDNIEALKNAFTVNDDCVIDAFDFDNEEPRIDLQTFVSLGELLFGFGFEVTFCPYNDIDDGQNNSIPDWQKRMQAFWDEGMKVSWWNLQCYSGGRRNRDNLSPWINALAEVVGSEAASSYLVPGLAVAGVEDVDADERLCPNGSDSFYTTFNGWQKLGLAGGFMWKYDALPQNPTMCSGTNNLANYVKAINEALTKSA